MELNLDGWLMFDVLIMIRQETSMFTVIYTSHQQHSFIGYVNSLMPALPKTRFQPHNIPKEC